MKTPAFDSNFTHLKTTEIAKVRLKGKAAKEQRQESEALG